MACRLDGAKPLSEPVLVLLIGPLGTNFSDILIGIQHFHSRKSIWKCRLRDGVHLSRPQCVKRDTIQHVCLSASTATGCWKQSSLWPGNVFFIYLHIFAYGHQGPCHRLFRGSWHIPDHFLHKQGFYSLTHWPPGNMTAFYSIIVKLITQNSSLCNRFEIALWWIQNITY